MNGVAVDNPQSPSAVATDSPTTGAGSTIDEHSPRQDSTTTPSAPTQTGVTDPPPLESTPTSTLHLASTGSEERREQNDTSSAVATIGDKGMVLGGENGRQVELEPVVKEEGEVTLDHANNQIELLEHASDTIVGVGEAGVVTEDGHEWLAEGDHELKRVKVYELIGSRWMDQGTAFCFGQFQEDTNEALLIARSERNYHDIILSTAIRSNDVYQRQQETLIVWTEPDGVDYALSFQDPEGCSEVWNFILEVQRHMNNDDGSPDPSLTTASIIRSGSLPRPQLGIIGEIEKAIKSLTRTPHLKERICEYIQQEGYIKSLIEVMNTAEDLESLENLHALCSLMQTILMMNDHGMYEHILEDDIFFGVVGMLEYDPDFPAHKANYRQFLHQTSQFHQPIPLRDIAIQRKIHHTYRLQFLKDVVLARALDDSTFNVLNSSIIFNQIDIIQHVQQDPAFLREVVRLFVDEEMLTGVPPKKTPALGPYSDPSGSQQSPQPQHMVISLNGDGDNLEKEAVSMDVDQKPANGVLPTQNGRTATKRSAFYAFSPPDDLNEHDISLRREVILLIQQLCIMGKNVQLPARLQLFRTLVDRGMLFATQWALGLSDKDQENRTMVSAGGEVLSALIDHDLNGVRTHVLKQEVAIEKERLVGKKGANKAETLLELVCKIVTQCRDLAIQSQVGDALKAWLDVPPNDSPPMAASEAGPPKPPIRKDEPGTERFMDYFYKGCVHILFKPLNELAEWRNVKGHVLPLSREETNRFVYLCDLLYNCISQHHFRSHFYIMSSNIMSRVASLLKAKDKHLRHASFRIFRQLLKQNNSNSHAQMMKHDVLKPILDLTLQESRRDNLLSCSCQEYFDSMRKENMKDMIKFCMTKHEEEVRKLAATPLGGQRFDLFIRRWEMNNEPLPTEEPKSDKPIDPRSWPGQGRHALDAEEEDYFNTDDDEEEPIPIVEPWSRGTGASSLHMNVGLKRKRRPVVGTGPKGHRPPLRTPILGSLVDYDDEEDDESSSKSVPPQSSSSQPLSPETPPPSPKLAHRQVPTIPSSGPPPTRNAKDEDEEDNLLEALVRPRARSQSPSPPVMTMVPLKPLEKRRRNDDDDDDDELLDRLRKSKKTALGSVKQGAAVAGRTKNGDDPPRKIKVKFGAASLVVASPASSLTTTTDIDVKDGDTG